MWNLKMEEEYVNPPSGTSWDDLTKIVKKKGNWSDIRVKVPKDIFWELLRNNNKS